MRIAEERDRLARALEFIATAGCGGELFPVGPSDTEYADDGNTVIRHVGPWRFLRGVGNTFLEAVEDEMQRQKADKTPSQPTP